MSEEAEQAKIHCNSCGGTTNHDVLASDENHDKYGSLHRYEMMKCCGCGGVSMRDMTYGLDSEDDWVSFQYPPEAPRRWPEWMEDGSLDIDDDIWQLIYQTYIATRNELYRLAAMGIRASASISFPR